MGDPCQVNTVVNGLRSTRQRLSKFNADIRAIARNAKSSGALGSLSDITNAIADVIDATSENVTRTALRELNAPLDKSKADAADMISLANNWIRHYATETRHMTPDQREQLKIDMFLWSEAREDTPPPRLMAIAPKTMASFIAAREAFAYTGRRKAERGVMTSNPAKAFTILADVVDKATGKVEHFEPGDIPESAKLESWEAFLAADNKYYPRLWEFDDNTGTVNNGPVKTGGSAKAASVTPSREDLSQGRGRKYKEVLHDSEAAKYTPEQLKAKNLIGLTKARSLGLEIDLVKTFLAKMPAQLNMIAMADWSKAVQVNFAQTFKTPAEAEAAGYAKVDIATKFTEKVIPTVKTGAPPNVKALGGADMYIQKDIARDMNDMTGAVHDILKINDDIMNMFKGAKTIYNAGYFTHNWLSQGLMASWSKHYSLTTGTESKPNAFTGVFRGGLDLHRAFKAGDAKAKAIVDEAMSMGIFQPHVSRIGFAEQAAYEQLTNTTLDGIAGSGSYGGAMKKLASATKKLADMTGTVKPGKVIEAADRRFQAASDTLAHWASMSDQLFKLGAYADLRQRKSMTPEQAANEVDSIFPRFDNLPYWSKQVNRFSSFWSFTHASSRIVTHHVAEGLRAVDGLSRGKIKASEALDQAMPVIKMLGSLGALGIINESVLAYNGFNDDERELWKNSTPSIDFSFAGVPFSTGLETPLGQANLTYSIPLPMTNVFFGNTVGEDLPYGRTGDFMSDKLGALANTLLASNPAITTIGEAVAFKDAFTGQPLARAEKVLTPLEKTAAIAKHATTKFTPYMLLNAMRYAIERDVENVSKTGPKRSAMSSAAAMLGFPLADWDITEAQSRADIQLRTRLRDIDKEIQAIQWDIRSGRVDHKAGIERMRSWLERRRALVSSRRQARPETLAAAKAKRLEAGGRR